jgi:hypothetical protein
MAHPKSGREIEFDAVLIERLINPGTLSLIEIEADEFRSADPEVAYRALLTAAHELTEESSDGGVVTRRCGACVNGHYR